MLDVARKYMPMWYLKDFVKYASWYKFTDIQVHLNDTSYNGHSRFRLESDIPGLTATDGYYTKGEYRDFQYYAEDYGIRIVSEFDLQHIQQCLLTIILN
ncbi:MAG: family 20 glycosylhydrolase [Thomasclavelia ramosa]